MCRWTVNRSNVSVIDHGDHNTQLDLGATIFKNPEAWRFKGKVTHRFLAKVCGNCGYTEFYVENPCELYEKAKEAEARG